MTPRQSRNRMVAAFLIYGIVAALLVLFFSGCALLQPCPVDAPAMRFVDDYRDFREDGLDEAETRMLDKDAQVVEAAVNEKAASWRLPTTGIPWVDLIAKLVGAGAVVAASVKTTNVMRDRKRKKRGEPTGDTKAV